MQPASSLQQAIEDRIGPSALLRPTFYNNPGGLRFELSTGGSVVAQFLTAHRKAHAICTELFADDPRITVCLSVYLANPPVAFRDTLRALRRAGIRIPRTKEAWLYREDGADEDEMPTLYLAFHADPAMLDGLLWCALSTDLGIEPSPRLSTIRLISLEKEVLVHPYDDRGMDIVGRNHALMSELYQRFGDWLLDYDSDAMAETFATDAFNPAATAA